MNPVARRVAKTMSLKASGFTRLWAHSPAAIPAARKGSMRAVFFAVAAVMEEDAMYDARMIELSVAQRRQRVARNLPLSGRAVEA